MNDSQSIINLDSLLNLSAQLNESLDCNSILKSAMLSLMGKLKILNSKSFLVNNNITIELPSRNIIANYSADELSQFFNSNQYGDIIEINFNNDSRQSLSQVDNRFDYLITLKNLEQNIAIILLGKRIDNARLSEEEKYYAKIVAQITSIALSNALNFKNLENQLREIERKNLLFQNLLNISNDFLSFGSEETIIKTFAFHLMGQLKINHYAIYLKKSGNEFAQILNKFNINFSNYLLGNISGDNFNRISSQIREKYKIIENIIPIFYLSDFKGILLLGKKISGDKFTEEDLLFAEMLSNTFIIALENHRLMQEEIKKQEIERDLAIAKEIQERLLPKSLPVKKNWDFYGMMKPSQMVGGDYFDYIELNEDEMLIIVADVSGKGIGASLLMANLQASLHSFALLNIAIDEIINNINKLLYKNTAEDKFITLFIGKLNCKDASLTYINAGHNPPIFIVSKNVIELDKGCLPLGVQSEIDDIEIGKIMLQNGDTLAIYTDGIVEATNSQGVEFGKEKLIENLIKYNNSSSKDISENLLNNLYKFITNSEKNLNEMIFGDDITLNIIRKK